MSEEWAAKHRALEQVTELRAELRMLAKMFDAAFDLDKMSAEGTAEQKAAVALVRKHLTAAP